jgi:hypothetical protein
MKTLLQMHNHYRTDGVYNESETKWEIQQIQRYDLVLLWWCKENDFKQTADPR